ncbi:MAG: hypothetical protein AAGI08_08330 [Bacteroidota bacterium]
MSKQARLDVDFNALNDQEVEAYLQEGGRGVAEYAASCNTIQAEHTTTVINGSCGRGAATDTLSDGFQDDIVEEF